jgi:signal transduction histidine kinase/CheY-like chemotaxis protein
MRLSFRGKLIAIAATAGGALVALAVAGLLTSVSTSRRLTELQDRYVPKLELAPKLEAQFEHLQRAFQDAVAAHDPDALAASESVKAVLMQQLSSAVPALTVGQIAALRSAMDDYYVSAHDVSRRLIAGETGERLVDAMTAMQSKQARAADLLTTATSFDRGELARAFQATRQVQTLMTNVRLAATILCLAVVLSLSLWMSRGLIRSLTEVATGLRRFGGGDFGKLIPVTNRDEIGELAEQANHMAASLRKLSEDRDRVDWVKGALAGISRELRGELEPADAANRAVRFLASYVGAPIGALFYTARDGSLELLGQYGAEGGAAAAGVPPRRFRIGEGLVGQAALSDAIFVVDDPPPDYLRVRSGLGEGGLRQLVFVPLEQLGQVRGVVELGLFSPLSERAKEAFVLVRETIAIAIEVARARTIMRELLAETQRQATRLTQQEEELRATNEELQTQQEELRQANEELIEQTEELEAQQRALAHNNAELEDARRTLEHKAAELSTVSDYKSQFLANMSHELRTPLNSMLLLSNLLAENENKNLTDKQVEFATTIHTAGKDLLRLINQVLDLAKIEAGKYEIAIAPVPVRQVADHMRRVFEPLAADKRLRLVVEVSPEVPEIIETDGHRMEQILSNLLGNAIKFTQQGEVALRIGVEPGAEVPEISFAVFDTGVGIAEADQGRIFAPFEQADAATDRRYGGTGLGLSISRDLARLLGGTLHVESRPGQGSKFWFALPLTFAPSEGKPAPATTPVRVPVAVKPGSADGPLLIIEDDHAFADAVAEMIASQGIECLVAPDGQAGLRLAREHRPVGIVLDVKLPDIDGWRVMEELRSDPVTANIPVHFVSGVHAPDRAMALGAVGYLTKPASRDDILRVITSLVPRGADGPNRVLVVEDDEITSESLSRQLSREKLSVHRAMTAEQAMAALEAERFACMVLDLSLPDMDGLDFLARMRQRHGANMPSVMIYTARALTKAEAKAIEAHVDAVVLKDGSSAQRLLDEIRLFSRRLKEGVGPRRTGAAPRVSPVAVNLTGKRVLVADDDMRTAYALSATLRTKGAEVFVADTGQAALDLLSQREDMQAVLMDIMMPEMDGLEAMRRIRRDPRFGTLPIIALTAKVMKGDQEKCLEAGATEFLPKPVDGDRLLTMLAGLLSEKPSDDA